MGRRTAPPESFFLAALRFQLPDGDAEQLAGDFGQAVDVGDHLHADADLVAVAARFDTGHPDGGGWKIRHAGPLQAFADGKPVTEAGR